MTKAKSKPCICCTHYSGGIPCQKGHKPRLFVNGGLRRVCDDFDNTAGKITEVHLPEYHSWVDSFMKIFGFKRA